MTTSQSTGSSIAFISHGGGPLPLLGAPDHDELVASLKQVASLIPRPEAIVVISAHWEEKVASVLGASRPPLVYDYYGFPQESYEIQYPAPGLPELAGEISGWLEARGMPSRINQDRGFDHGLFVPLKLMYPEADIPCVQVSLVSSLSPETHINLGRALQPLTTRPILILGSGFSFHNLQAFFSSASDESEYLNEGFEDWLHHTCTDTSLPEAQRMQQLLHWSEAPGARYCHPREEHLLPLHVCYGVAGTAATHSLKFSCLGKKASAYVWLPSGSESP